MPDEQDRAEALDDDELGEMPPDKPLGAQAYGAAGAEPHADESVRRRAAREEPDELDPWADDTGGPAEAAAVHMIDEELEDFDSSVDDPELEAAWETDPEVER